MKKLTVIWLGLTVGGCATTEQLAESNVKLDAIEKRLVRIETDLYEPVKSKKGSTDDYSKYQLKNTEQIKRILDETNKIEGICGYKFGAVAEGPVTQGSNEQRRDLKTSFRLLDKVALSYTDVYKRLYLVHLYKYVDGVSPATVEEEFIKMKDVVEHRFGIEMKMGRQNPKAKENSCSYSGRDVRIRIWTNMQQKNGAGFFLDVSCPRIVEEDKARADREAKKISIPEGEGADVL